MSDIDKLTKAVAFTPEMQFPLYDPANKQPRKISGQQVVDFIGAGVQAIADSISNRIYPGSYAADPIARPDGSAVQAGDQYFNSTIARKKTYSGSVWGVDNLDAATLAGPGGDALVWGTRPGVYRIGLAASLATDCGPLVQAAVNSFGGKAGAVVFDPAYTYTQKSTVFVPYNVSIDFNSALIVPTSGGTLVGGYLYLLNMNASQAQVELLGTSMDSSQPFIHGFRADATSALTTARGFFMASKHQFEAFWCRSMTQAVKKKGGTNDQYIDRLRFRDFEVQSPQGTDYMLDVDYYGDALDIDGYHHSAGATSNQNAIHVRNCNGGGIRNLINGSVLAEQCSAFSMDHIHNEYGAIELRSTSASVRDVFQWYRPDLGQTTPLAITVSGGGGRYPHSVSLQNYRFVIQHSVAPFAANYVDADHFDIQYQRGVSLNMDNVKRFFFVNVDPSLGYESAPRITHDGTNVTAQWDTNPSAHCKSSNVSGGGLVRTAINTLPIPGVAVTDYNLSSSAHGTWTEATGTYFYAFQMLWGPRDRRVGRTSVAERSVAIADTAHIARLLFEPADASATGVCTLRLYRGTASGSYDKVVEMPVGSDPMFYDMGHYLGTGERWRTRAAAGVDAINTAYTKVDVVGAQVVVRGTAAPTVGTWTTGDTVVNDAPLSSDVPSYLCTGGGTPGTWLARSKVDRTFTFTYDPPSIAAGASTFTTVSIPGLVPSDKCLSVSFDINTTGSLAFVGTCMTDGVVIRVDNTTGAAVDRGSGTLSVTVRKL